MSYTFYICLYVTYHNLGYGIYFHFTDEKNCGLGEVKRIAQNHSTFWVKVESKGNFQVLPSDNFTVWEIYNMSAN